MDNIKVSIEETSGLKRKMTVEVPAAEVDRCYDSTLKEYRRHAVLPGYRKGKAPKERIERHLERFWLLIEAINTNTPPPEGWLEAVQREDGLFPLINAADWARLPTP